MQVKNSTLTYLTEQKREILSTLNMEVIDLHKTKGCNKIASVFR